MNLVSKYIVLKCRLIKMLKIKTQFKCMCLYLFVGFFPSTFVRILLNRDRNHQMGIVIELVNYLGKNLYKFCVKCQLNREWLTQFREKRAVQRSFVHFIQCLIAGARRCVGLCVLLFESLLLIYVFHLSSVFTFAISTRLTQIHTH